jgi:hypothetical protein
MKRQRPEACKGRDMINSAVAFVLFEAVSRIEFRVLFHD